MKKICSLVLILIFLFVGCGNKSENNGYIGSTKYIDRFDEDCGYGPKEIHDEINVSGSEEITIWGVTAYKGSFETRGGDIEEEVKAADWGMVLKVFFK